MHIKGLGVLALLGVFLPLAAAGAESPRQKANPSQTKIICKTGPEKRPAGVPLKLYFNYNLPVMFEPEDPTLPFGRQLLLLSGRPVMQLFFEKAPGPAGRNGENLQPMQCAFAGRAIKEGEPAQVQILLPSGRGLWISQGVGQKGPTAERAALQPAGDWSFAHQHEQIFTLELDDLKNFITTRMPVPL